MKNNRIFMLPILLVAMIFGAFEAMAVPSCEINVTATTNGTGASYLTGGAANISIFINSSVKWTLNESIQFGNLTIAPSGESPFQLLQNGSSIGSSALIFNGTGNVSSMNFTVDTRILNDSKVYTFIAQLSIANATALPTPVANCSKNYITDNTNPAFSSRQPDGTDDEDGTFTYQALCSNFTYATLYIDGVPRTTFGHGSNGRNCTFTETLVTNGIHSWNIIATDGLSTTTASNMQINVKRGGAGAMIAALANGQAQVDAQGQVVATPPSTQGTGLQGIVSGVIGAVQNLVSAVISAITGLFK